MTVYLRFMFFSTQKNIIQHLRIDRHSHYYKQHRIAIYILGLLLNTVGTQTHTILYYMLEYKSKLVYPKDNNKQQKCKNTKFVKPSNLISLVFCVKLSITASVIESNRQRQNRREASNINTSVLIQTVLFFTISRNIIGLICRPKEPVHCIFQLNTGDLVIVLFLLLNWQPSIFGQKQC